MLSYAKANVISLKKRPELHEKELISKLFMEESRNFWPEKYSGILLRAPEVYVLVGSSVIILTATFLHPEC
jgi:hypothetical protein